MSQKSRFSGIDADAILTLVEAPWLEVTTVREGLNLVSYGKELPYRKTGDLVSCDPMDEKIMIEAVKRVKKQGGRVRGIRFFIEPAPKEAKKHGL